MEWLSWGLLRVIITISLLPLVPIFLGLLHPAAFCLVGFVIYLICEPIRIVINGLFLLFFRLLRRLILRE